MKTKAYKAVDYLKSKKAIAAYVNAALDDGDPAVLLQALRTVAEARGGMSVLAKAAGVSRESLYRTLSADGNPKIDTLISLLEAMDLKLSVEPREAA